MTQPTDTQPAPADSLLELLYGDLPADEVERVEAEVAGDDQLKAALADFRSVRALFAELPLEEPPAAVSAKVLSAAAAAAAPRVAARSAEQSAESVGFFGWLGNLFKPLAYHPGLAAAASLLLVAGVTGTFYLAGRDQVARPFAVQNAPAQMEPERAVRAKTSAPKKDMLRATTDLAPLTPAIEESQRAFALETPAPQKTAASRSRAVSNDRKPRPKPASNASKGESFGDDLESATSGLGGSTSGGVSLDGTLANKGGKRAGEGRAPTSRPPPPAEPSNTPAADSALASRPRDKISDSSKSAEKSGAANANKAKQLHKQAVFRAKKGDCATVLKLGARIRKFDSYFYDTVHLRSPSVRRCRSTKTIAK